MLLLDKLFFEKQILSISSINISVLLKGEYIMILNSNFLNDVKSELNEKTALVDPPIANVISNINT